MADVEVDEAGMLAADAVNKPVVDQLIAAQD